MYFNLKASPPLSPPSKVHWSNSLATNASELIQSGKKMEADLEQAALFFSQ